ncbi:MAG TPA: RIP metalloprotease RseP [Burkholderiaceae bacterium]|nr:RIP metalloprotease RseP [Burkholderiaceae bacterium]
MLFTLLAFAVALGLLITFHELGHYTVARLCGVRVLRFSIGFGQVLYRKVDRHGTEWAVSAIPLGGYVKMQDKAPAGATPREVAESFENKSLGQRAAIVLAGPFANFVLAALLYAGLNLFGVFEPAAILGQPAASTPAARAGLQGGEKIVAVGDQPVESWNQLRWELLDVATTGGQVTLRAEDAYGASRDYVLYLDAQPMVPEEVDILAQAGLALAAPRPVVLDVIEGGAGQAAGLRAGDIIVASDDLHNPTSRELISYISTRAGQTLDITVLRDGMEIRLGVTPQTAIDEEGREVARIGVMLGADFPMVLIRHGPLQSLYQGAARTLDTAWFSLKMMGRMVTGHVSVRNISGPVTIADYAGQTARAGLVSYISFLALISVSIGVLNLLPIPMLDGGHLMFYAIEAVRGGPIPEKWIEHSHRLGLALLAALMGLAFFNDFVRLLT